MAENFGFFDAQNLGTGDAPSWDRSYLAELFAKYFHLFISSGVFSGSPTDPDQLLVQEQAGYNITLTAGYAFIRGYWYENDSAMTHAIDPTDGQYQRIDRLVIRWDRANRSIYSTIIKGTPSLNAVPPDILRGDDFYDLSLAQISISNQATQITQADITSEILNPEVCGIVTSLVWQVDTTTIYDQIQSDLERYQNEYQAEWNAWSQMSRSEFDTWFATIQNILDENIAATLLSMILNQRFTATASVDTEGRLILTPTAGQAGDMYSMFFEVPASIKTKQVVIGTDVLDVLNNRNKNVNFSAEFGVPSLFIRKGSGVYQIGGGGGSSGGGGGLTGIVVCYQYTQPDPEDYEGLFLIWVQAPEGIEIGEVPYTLSYDAPEEVVSGDMWIPLSNAGYVIVSITDDEGVTTRVKIAEPRYYGVSGWEVRPSYYYQLGEFIAFPKLELFRAGIVRVPMILTPGNGTNGSFSASVSGTFTVTGANNAGNGYPICMVSSEAIPLAGINTVVADVTTGGGGGTVAAGLSLVQNVNFNGRMSPSNSVMMQSWGQGATQMNLNVANYNDVYYIWYAATAWQSGVGYYSYVTARSCYCV